VLNSQYVYAEALRHAVARSTAWLDLGCGHQFLPDWLPERERRLAMVSCRAVGIDMDAAALRAHPDLRLRIVGSVEHLPVASATFDLVTANMVVEHVEHPEALFREISRVLKLGGTLLVHTPNRVGYTTTLTRAIPASLRPRVARWLQGREERDVYPTFYRANTVDQLRDIGCKMSLSPVELRTVLSSPQMYAVPVLGVCEDRFLTLLSHEKFAKWRPCILGRFRRISASDVVEV
jgi:SAM-dependent methyltransferase